MPPAVTGVIAETADGNVQFNAAKGVILATGDYQNDDDMMAYYLPDLQNLGRKQMNKTGDGHKMVVWAGGAHRGHARTRRCCTTSTPARAPWPTCPSWP